MHAEDSSLNDDLLHVMKESTKAICDVHASNLAHLFGRVRCRLLPNDMQTDAMGSCHGTLKGSMDTLAGSVWQFYWLAGQGLLKPARGPEPGANIFLGPLA
eukprot:Em0005g665a